MIDSARLSISAAAVVDENVCHSRMELIIDRSVLKKRLAEDKERGGKESDYWYCDRTPNGAADLNGSFCLNLKAKSIQVIVLSSWKMTY